MHVHTWQHFEVQGGSYVNSGWHISVLGSIDVVDQLEHACELPPRPAWHSGQIPLRSSLTIILACWAAALCRFRPQNSCRKALGNSRLFFANNYRYGSAVSLNCCSQNGGNLYRAPYYNRNLNIGPRIDSNLGQSPYGFQNQMRLRLHGLEKVWVEKDKPIHRTAGKSERKERLPRLKGKQLLFPTNFSCPNEHFIN